jgi:hypothetical protein
MNDLPDLAVKFVDGSDTLVRGLGMPFGGPWQGRDLDGEFFSAKTDFMFGMIAGERPVLFDHGLDPTLDNEIIGRVVEWKMSDAGVWTIVQLDRRARYIDKLKELVERGILSFSSGAYPPLARVNKGTGEIERWPWVELTLTPTPANPYAVASKSTLRWVADQMGAEATEATDDPRPPRIIASIHRPRVATMKATWSSAFITALPDSAFACVNSSGRHYPHHNAEGSLDLPHLRAALSRIGDASNEQFGKGHLAAHARSAGVGQ